MLTPLPPSSTVTTSRFDEDLHYNHDGHDDDHDGDDHDHDHDQDNDEDDDHDGHRNSSEDK